MTTRWHRRGFATLTVAAITGLAITGCGSNAPATNADATQSLAVVASFYPLQFVAEQVGGDRATVTNLTKPGAEPHDLELAPQDLGTLSDADLALYLQGFQPAVDEAVEQSPSGRVLEVSESAELSLTTVDDHSPRRARRSLIRTSGSTRSDWQSWPMRSPSP